MHPASNMTQGWSVLSPDACIYCLQMLVDTAWISRSPGPPIPLFFILWDLCLHAVLIPLVLSAYPFSGVSPLQTASACSCFSEDCLQAAGAPLFTPEVSLICLGVYNLQVALNQ